MFSSCRGLCGLAASGLLALAVLAFANVASAGTPACGTTCLKPAAAFNRTGGLTNGGRGVNVSGPIGCPAGDSVQLRATVSQRSTGAVAQGFWNKVCAGSGQHWHTTASVTDGVTMSAGCVHATGLAIVRHAGKPVDAFQWLRTVTLDAAGKAGAVAAC